MRNKEKKCSSKKVVALIILMLVIIFLMLPLIFGEISSEKQGNYSSAKALPLTTENPFLSYLKLLKDFYTPNKEAKQKKQFTKVNHALAKQDKPKDIFIDEETQPVLAQAQNSIEKASATDYYAHQEDNNPSFDMVSQESQQVLTEQTPFDDILMEGLYETSHTDPYEVKQAARRTLFDLFSPRRHFALLMPGNATQSIFSNPTHYAKNESDFLSDFQSNKTLLATPMSNKNASLFGSYNHGSINSFNTNQQVLGKLDISGLPFEEQVNLVAGRLNTIHQKDQQERDRQNTDPRNPNHKPPMPPIKKDSFDPTKWSPEINKGSCHDSENENAKEEKTEEDTQAERLPEKIGLCDKDMAERLKKVTPKMQENYNYFIVSGKYKGRIMIPAYGSLPDTVLKTISSDEYGAMSLKLPKQLKGKNLSKNTDKTEFEFVSALKPQVFEEIMADEKTILLSVEEEYAQRFPDKTILIQSGQIETYPGANQIINKINNFLVEKEKLKKEAQQKVQEDKQQKTQALDNKVSSAI